MRHLPPADEFLPFFMDNMFGPFLYDIAVFQRGGQKNQPNAVITGSGQGDVIASQFLAEKSVRHLNEDPGSVTGFRIAATRTAVAQIFQDLQSITNNVMGFLSLDMRDKADPAGIMFKARVI